VAEYVEVSCPYCGEPGEVDVDESGPPRQSFVQDCAVCCHPWQVDARRDGDGDWSVSVRTDDD
jgi:hypothetical protein